MFCICFVFLLLVISSNLGIFEGGNLKPPPHKKDLLYFVLYLKCHIDTITSSVCLHFTYNGGNTKMVLVLKKMCDSNMALKAYFASNIYIYILMERCKSKHRITFYGYLSNPGKAGGCSTNTVVIYSLVD